MLLFFNFVNIETGRTEIPGYIDASEIVSWNVWTVPDEGGPGIHRSLRGKKIVVLNIKGGLPHFSDQSFHLISWHILEDRGQKDMAEVHKAECAAELINSKKSSLAVS